jgi:pimeloyl-ACP methyl ester carboxylesterase
MRRRIVYAVLLLLVLAVAIPVLGSLAALDWSRSHSGATAALPVFGPDVDAGLVRIPANGLEFRARVAGMRGDGPGLILLHGFPATSAMWLPVMEAARARGYRVVAYDQRGYSPGARPDGIAAYTIDHPAADVLAIADAVGFEDFHLVGHDWGCVAGWVATLQHPDRIRSWTALSIPYPGAMIDELRAGLPTYIRILNLPGVSEVLLSLRDFRRLRSSLPDVEALRADAVAALSEPGALTGALDWYRAIPASFAALRPDSWELHTSTVFLWGAREGWVTPERLERQRALMRGPYEALELDAGHWVVEDQTRVVIDRILAHLERVDGSAPPTP